MSQALASRVVRLAPSLAAVVALGAPAAAQIVFEPPVSLSLTHLTQGVLVADVNADGHADLISQPRFEFAFNPPHVSVLLGAGDGTFGAPIVTTLGTTSSSPGSAACLRL